MSIISLDVNGKKHAVDVDPQTPLLYVLRNDLGLNGVKFGCGTGQCGSCTIIIDGETVRSCVTTVGSVKGGKITTLEGLGTEDKPHPIQRAWIEEQAVQCGYCMNGHIMTSKVLLDRTPRPTEAQIREELSDVLCRCGTYYRIIRAVKRASDMMQSAEKVGKEVGKT